MTNILPSYLGKPASVILADGPFSHWPVEKSYDNDLEEIVIHYVFPHHGLELRCDQVDKVNTVFMYADEFDGFDESLFGVPFSLNRQEVKERLGPPSKSGGPINDRILGAYGAWDRFTKDGYVIHVEYRADTDRINKITLMRTDSVPGR